MKLSDRILSAVILELTYRGGFTDWWDTIDEDIQQEILDNLTTKVDKELDR